MNTEYFIINPSGNVTALVTTPTKKSDYQKVCQFIMQSHKRVEQVGFVDYGGSVLSLDMSGGEFCGNATLSAVALYSELTGKLGAFNIKVSGAEKIIKAEVSKYEDFYLCQCEMQFPLRDEDIVINNNVSFPVIRLDGISHIIAPFDFDRKKAEQIVKKYAKENNLSAVGFMFYDKKISSLTPLVYVTKIDTLFYENSCASGSCAVCAYESILSGNDVSLDLKQPGGVIKVSSNSFNSFITLSNNIIIEEHLIKEIK